MASVTNPDHHIPVNVLCGPLLNYKYITQQLSPNPVWHGSVLIVTPPDASPPEMVVCLNRVDVNIINISDQTDHHSINPTFLYGDQHKSFYRYSLTLSMKVTETEWSYKFINTSFGLRHPDNHTFLFVVPAVSQSMRLIFHSCNGFSVGTNMRLYSGPNGTVWKDVLRFHSSRPFHVMIGGGDQIYNDGIRVDGPLQSWTAISNPVKRRHHDFTEHLRAQCDEYYFNNYVYWFGSLFFSTANSTIPQLNMWDDHDIIDGFGSYTDHFMRCSVFRGIGGVAYKYYLLFQHHLAPPRRTFVTDDAEDPHVPHVNTRLAPDSTYEADLRDPMYVIGPRPGPYVEERSRNVVTQLGARIAFVAIDARTERTRHQINYDDTYHLLFERIRDHILAFPQTEHLILLLGVPIAYPRLQWLDACLRSPLIAPIAFMNRRFGFAGSLFNQFDGKVDLLDDLDDHYTARQHKKERRNLVQNLQHLGRDFAVRVTILSGDVHLAAFGRFYSHPRYKLAAAQDWRYITNVISSAITNEPPPSVVANLLARRNKIHHLDHDTDETLLEIFDRDPISRLAGAIVERKTATRNHATMPSRNFAIIEESIMISPPPDLPSFSSNFNQGGTSNIGAGGAYNPRFAIGPGEQGAGSNHPVATGLKAKLDMTEAGVVLDPIGLNVTFRVEVDSKTGTGETDGYGVWIPPLNTVKKARVPGGVPEGQY